MQKRIFIIGLGNPGKKYKNTRHNIGKILIEHLVNKYKIKMSPGRGRFYFGKKNTNFPLESEIFLVETTTYMNLSGESVYDVISQFEARPEELLIVCDDFNLPFENIRLRLSGSDGGQKGLRSIIEVLNTDQFPRLRMGIAPDEEFDAIDFVLSEFSEKEKKALPEILERSGKCIETLLLDGPQKAMGVTNKKI